MANSKIDNQMERMKFLMEYRNTPKTDTKAGIEYHVNTNDGKTYGIIRENNMYYIKTTTPDKANIKESYEYLGGFNYRNEHGYKSFNEASKHLELEIMHINESCGKHEDVSVFNTDKSKEDMQSLTEAARTELDRMHQILENSYKCSGKVGHYKNCYGDPENKGTASSENTTKNNAPFEEKVEATLNKDPKFNGTVDGATPDNKKVAEGTVNSDLQSDKMKTANSGSENDFKDTHDDLEGDGVADKKPTGAKAVKMNESFMEDDNMNFTPEDFEETGDDITTDDFSGDEVVDTTDDNGLAGFDTEEEGDINPDMFNFSDGFEDDSELDNVLNEFFDEANNADVESTTIDESDVQQPSEDILTGPNVQGGNSVKGEETMDRMDEDAENQKPEGAGKKESKIVGPDSVMDGPHGSLDAQTWDKLQESIDRITDSIYSRLSEGKLRDKIAAKKKEKEREKLKSAKTEEEYLQESLDRIVAEEVQKLDAWGKHPRYQKPAFQTPDNKEVSLNGSEDWNDDSTKGSEPYGRKIGSSAPFDKQVDILTDAVLKRLKESYIKKK